MACDFIREKTTASLGRDADIINAIRTSINEIWKNHIQYESAHVDLNLLIASWSTDGARRFTVVSGAAIRDGRDVEACGIGNATFLALADRFLHRGLLRTVGGTGEAVRMFTIFAMQQTKQTVPGVGGNSRIVTLRQGGELKWEKSFKVAEVQNFFSSFHNNFRHIAAGRAADPEYIVRTLAKLTLRDIKVLRKELIRIENNPSLI